MAVSSPAMPMPAAPLSPKNPAKDKNAAGDAAAPVNPHVDEHLHGFWDKNKQAIYVFCIIVLAGYLVRSGWEYFNARREEGIESDYAAATTPEKLRAFAAAHPDNVLGGVAQLQLADQAYAASLFTEAADAYAGAETVLKTGPLASRARLGLAMAEIQAGRSAEGEAGLRTLSEDTHELKAIRTGATYQLASLAAAAGRTEDLQRLVEQLMQIDPSSPWTQRALALRTLMPDSAAKAPAAPGAPGISFKPGAN
jgi:predicted negative regulator of RcsB-dependent stress response